MSINAIETYYGGHRFRSRLEARWAVVFDSLGIRWEYEPQGYRVGEQRRPYLPDFYLTELGWWVEVKGSAEHLDIRLLLDAAHPTLGLGRPDAHYRTNLLILGDIPRWDVPSAHFTISRSQAIGTPSPMMSHPIPGGGCGGNCLFTGPLFGLHHFAPVSDAIPDIVADSVGVTAKRYELLRRMGALFQPACRSSANRPQMDLTQAVPLRQVDGMPRLVAAYVLGRTARFEHGEVA